MGGWVGIKNKIMNIIKTILDWFLWICILIPLWYALKLHQYINKAKHKL